MSQTRAFVEKAYLKELEENKIIYSIDINKCRKNMLYIGEFHNCVFIVFDKVDQFKGTIFRPGFIMLILIITCHYVGMGCIVTI